MEQSICETREVVTERVEKRRKQKEDGGGER